MSRLSPEQFARVEALYFEASGVDASNRDHFVGEACQDDAVVRDEVLAMLRHAAGGEGIDRLTRIAPGTSLGRAGTRGGDGPAIRAKAGTPAWALLGERVGGYEIAEILGQGGMGVVYRATDSRLGRAVAVKALPASMADDPARVARFLREARILASLSHPNIATVYDLEEHGDPPASYLVMEFIDGRTLADRIGKGRLAIDESLRVCAAVAAALEAAHDAGVVHRDLKPHNVMLCADGRVKVLDFGLAREMPAREAGDSGTVSVPESHATREGAVMGTPPYMSPEQVRGQEADRRTDVFALGCILYECLTGRLAFAGGTSADVAAAILHREPDWAALSADVPASVRRLLMRCVAKDLSRRLRDMGDVRVELEEALDAKEWLGPLPPPRAEVEAQILAGRRHRFVRRLTIAALLLAVVALGLAVAGPYWNRPPAGGGGGASAGAGPAGGGEPATRSVERASAGATWRFSLRFPTDRAQPVLSRVRVAMARNGGRMVVSAAGGFDVGASGPTTAPTVRAGTPRPFEAQRVALNTAVLRQHFLWARSGEDAEFRPLGGTEGALLPAVSPDGQWVVHYDDGAIIRRHATGGAGQRLAEVAGWWGGYDYGRDSRVYYVPAWGQGVWRVPATGGGAPESVTAVDAAADEVAHLSPCLTPDGQTVLVTVVNGRGDARVDAVDLATRARRPLVGRGASARVARTPRGYCVMYERAGSLYAAPVEARTLRRLGNEVMVAGGVLSDHTLYAAAYDVSDDGVLAYVPGPVFKETSVLAFALGEGPTTVVSKATVPLAEPHVTDDGKRMSVIWKGRPDRLFTYDPTADFYQEVVTGGTVTTGAISPAGRQIAYGLTTADGVHAVHVRSLAEGTTVKVCEGLAGPARQVSWTADSAGVVFSAPPRAGAARDVFYAKADVAGEPPTVVAATAGEDRAPRVSPNGRWIAFAATGAGGVRDVQLRSFPDGRVSRQITQGGGDWPVWSPDGTKVYYKKRGRIYMASVSPEDGTITHIPVPHFSAPFGQADPELGDYTITHDNRTLVVEQADLGRATQVNVVINWWRVMGQ